MERSAFRTQPGPTIGVFDSGVGGLTVLRALLPLIPDAHYLYLGDTARLPYGSKSRETIARYAVSAALELEARGAQLIVIACNTATALALPELRAACTVPVIGVIDPGADAALVATTATRIAGHPERRPQAESKDLPYLSPPQALQTLSVPNPHVLVLATAATVASHAYRDALAARNLTSTEKACPLLVPLVEEGWTDHAVTRDVLRIYLREALDACPADPAAVVLGCTHYPLLAPVIEQTLRDLHSHAVIIDSAAATAHAVAATLGITPAPTPADATFSCLATDGVARFATLGSRFLGHPIPAVELLDLGG